MEIHYTQHGEYFLPDLARSPNEEPRYGKYGMLCKTFLKEHRRGTYSALLMSGKLTCHLNEIDGTVREQVQQTMAVMVAQTCEPDKASDFIGCTAAEQFESPGGGNCAGRVHLPIASNLQTHFVTAIKTPRGVDCHDFCHWRHPRGFHPLSH